MKLNIHTKFSYLVVPLNSGDDAEASFLGYKNLKGDYINITREFTVTRTVPNYKINLNYVNVPFELL